MVTEQLSPFVEQCVLPTLRELQKRQGKMVTSSMVADFLGVSQKAAYNYLRQLEVAGLATRRRPNGRRWGAAG